MKVSLFFHNNTYYWTPQRKGQRPAYVEDCPGDAEWKAQSWLMTKIAAEAGVKLFSSTNATIVAYIKAHKKPQKWVVAI